ncbi:hypothetical protein LINPERHAP2_LOCUS35310 [Linum perenne]
MRAAHDLLSLWLLRT